MAVGKSLCRNWRWLPEGRQGGVDGAHCLSTLSVLHATTSLVDMSADITCCSRSNKGVIMRFP